ncbi:tetratricopeptide repeat protein [Bradyrhizobium sp.]|uniref:O-linked N-acetylglucosamine transferase family protein n=1 Tax=Bradyrhizobium sp. TaxID=376 RepID=UPI002609D1A6|nr:tetratricopeptide repeat protein [Bradyrhizobium sp.]
MLGVSEHQRGNSQSAERLLRHSLLVNPQSAATRYALGVILSALQRNDEALVCYDDLIALTPDFVDAHMKRGLLLSGVGRFAEAIVSYDNVIAIDPRHLEALQHKGEALHYLGRFDDAIACYNQILTLQPTHFAALVDRGCAFKDLGRANEAIAEFNLALTIAPDNTIILINRGETRLALRQNSEALEDFDRVISINPRIALGWLGRANVLMLRKNVSEALEACERAVALEPKSTKGLTQIGQCHALLGNAEAAVSFFDRALAIKPDDDIALQSRIFSLDFGSGDYALHQAARSEWWRRIGSKISAKHPPHHENSLDPARRIVVGYVSGDFRDHSAARAFRPVLENHDKSRFEVICYCNSLTQDDVTDSFRHIADRWRDVVQWPDDRLADCIRADKVDILIDLSGYTRGNRLRVFARKPAPIQVTAWGHGSGTGMPTMDYLFTDPVSVPREVCDLFAEQIYHLPCSIIIEPPPAELRVTEPPVTSNGYVTYGVFTRASRFSNSAIELWARILRSDVTSRLIIKDRALNDGSVQTRLLESLAAHGVTPDRVSLMGSTCREEHLAAYRCVDIGLDPFPHGGGVSTWESLYMGVPVVTKMGNSLSTRIGGAILSAIDMRDWIASSEDQYVDIALRSTPDRLRTIRNQLPDLIAARCSPASYTKAVERAYRTMWEKYCGERPG